MIWIVKPYWTLYHAPGQVSGTAQRCAAEAHSNSSRPACGSPCLEVTGSFPMHCYCTATWKLVQKTYFSFLKNKQTNKQQQRRSDQMLHMCQKDNLTRGLGGHGMRCSQVTSQITLPAFILHHFSDPLLPLDIMCFHLTWIFSNN